MPSLVGATATWQETVHGRAIFLSAAVETVPDRVVDLRRASELEGLQPKQQAADSMFHFAMSDSWGNLARNSQIHPLLVSQLSGHR